MSSNADTSRPVPPVEAFVFHVRKNALPALVSGLGGAGAIWLLAALTENLGQLLLIAPFGASCVLLFALPQSPLARPSQRHRRPCDFRAGRPRGPDLPRQRRSCHGHRCGASNRPDAIHRNATSAGGRRSARRHPGRGRMVVPAPADPCRNRRSRFPGVDLSSLRVAARLSRLSSGGALLAGSM